MATDVAGFGGYALDTKVAEGPRGTVWRAVHVGTGRQVAVKELSAALRGDEEYMARYRERVAKLAALGEHPNRVPVLEFLEEPERVWIVEPWIAGRRLDTIVAAQLHGGLTPEESVAIVVGVLAGLASTKGLVHGDVRPENIVVAADGRPLITDFGIPLPLGEEAGEDVYRSGEAVRGGKLDARSDVYSAAAVLHELLGGTPELVQVKPPTETRAELDADTDAEPTTPSPKLSQPGKKLTALVRRALSEDPKKRPARADTFRASLDRAARDCFDEGWQDKATARLAETAGAPPERTPGPAAAGENVDPTPLAGRLSRRNRRPIPHGTVLGLSFAILLLLAMAALTVDSRTGDSAARTQPPPPPPATPEQISGSDIAGTWAVIVSVVESSGFFDSSAGSAALKAYVITSDCSKTPCDYRLTVAGSPGEFPLPRIGENYVLKEEGPNDCVDLDTGQVRVPGGGRATVELTLHPTAARKGTGDGWVATAFEGGVVTTFESQNPDCGGGAGVQRTALKGTRQ